MRPWPFWSPMNPTTHRRLRRPHTKTRRIQGMEQSSCSWLPSSVERLFVIFKAKEGKLANKKAGRRDHNALGVWWDVGLRQTFRQSIANWPFQGKTAVFGCVVIRDSILRIPRAADFCHHGGLVIHESRPTAYPTCTYILCLIDRNRVGSHYHNEMKAGLPEI